MRKRQVVSLWFFAIMWALTIFIWFLLSSGSSTNWGVSEFFQATFFWGVFAFLSHITLGRGKNKQ